MIDVIKEHSIHTDVIKFGMPREDQEEKALREFGGKDQPIIFINGKAIQWNDIIDLKISSKEFLPSISLIFEDTYGIFTSDVAITNGDLISFYLRPPNDSLKPIRTDFYIISSKPRSGGSGKTVFYLQGIINLPILWAEVNKAYVNKTSFEVFDTLTDQLNLGMTTNISSTNDRMTWINGYDTYKNFIKKTTQNAYKGDEAFFKTFIDLYYNLNFIEINQELPISDAFLDDEELEETVNGLGEDNKNVPNILNNLNRQLQSNISFSNSYLIDESGTLSLNSGYKKIIQYYSENEREELEFTFDPLITPDNEQNFLMKGRKTDEYYRDLKKYLYRGNEFNMSNVHENFKVAELINYQNNEELEKLKLAVELDRVNISLYRYMKIPVIFVRDFSSRSGYDFNRFLSGNFLIDGYELFKDGEVLKQRVFLTRREWPYPSEK